MGQDEKITRKEYTRAYIEEHLDELIGSLLSGDQSLGQWSKRAGIDQGTMSRVIRECGFAYGPDGWTYTRPNVERTLPTTEVEDLELDEDEQSEIAELINRQDRVIKAMIVEIKELRARDEAKSKRLFELEQSVESLTNERNNLSLQLAKWRAERQQTKKREIQLAKQNGLGTLDEAMLLLGKS